MSSSTALAERMDAESVRDVMTEYFREMREAIETHRGTIEKFIGDAVVAVFGVPETHEDDPLRAVRAASDMADRLRALNERLEARFGCRLDHRIGINTGEVVAGGSIGGETFATGDTVNVAARLEQAAAPGQILIGESTHRLVRDVVRADRLEPIAAKGKRLPIAAYRLKTIARTSQPPHRTAELVGRDAEIARLRQAYRTCVRERHSTFLLVVGEPGVGKSRLVDAFGAELPSEALLYTGRCLSYGAGITYWALSEIVRQASHMRETDSKEQARERLERTAAAEEHGPRIAALLARAIGLEEGIASTDEIRWAAGLFFQGLARTGPVVLVFDDLQWAERPLLDLIDHIAQAASTSPILTLGLARLDLFDFRAQLGDEVIRLDPLDDPASSLLLEHLMQESEVLASERSRLLASAGGNPLFLEELVGVLADAKAAQTDDRPLVSTADGATLVVPSTIQGLLAARLDRLPDVERQTLECGSVEGQVFHRGAVEHLSDPTTRDRVPVALDRLVQKGYVQPGPPSFADETAFRFRHILIRDAAYGTTPKKVRARLHERLVDWTELAAGDRQAEVEEILGFHLEQAHRHLSELGTIDEHGRGLADRAAGKLSSAGRRNFARGNVAAASDLLARASSLIPDPGDRVPVLVDLAEVLARSGNVAESTGTAEEVLTLADAAGDRVSRAYAMLTYLLTAVFPFVHHSVPHEEAVEEIRSSIRVFEDVGNERGLAKAYATLDLEDQTAGRGDQMRPALTASLGHARRAGLEREEAWALGRLCITSVWDATPVDEAAEQCRAVIASAGDRPLTRAQAQMSLAGLLAMSGDFEAGREGLTLVHEIHGEMGSPMQAVMHTAPMATYIAFWAGDHGRAEEVVRPAVTAVQRFGSPSSSRWLAALLADALCGQGILDEAEAVSRKALDGLPTDHRQAQIDWRIPRSRILAKLGRQEEGERLAREAVSLASNTDFLLHQTMSLVALADVLTLRHDSAGAEATLATALEVCERKQAPGLAAYVTSRP